MAGKSDRRWTETHRDTVLGVLGILAVCFLALSFVLGSIQNNKDNTDASTAQTEALYNACTAADDVTFCLYSVMATDVCEGRAEDWDAPWVIRCFDVALDGNAPTSTSLEAIEACKQGDEVDIDCLARTLDATITEELSPQGQG